MTNRPPLPEPRVMVSVYTDHGPTLREPVEDYFDASDLRAYADAQNAELVAECARLREDAERLDWLADPANDIAQVLLPTECVTANLGSMRDAIDAARAIDNAREGKETK